MTATILTDSSCAQCIDPKLTVDAFKKGGVTIADEKEVAWDSAEGQQLINHYNITKVPTFLFSPDIDVYDTVKNTWSRIGTVEQDKTYIARNLPMPFRDLGQGKIVGLVDIIYLTDATCQNCYQPEVTQKNILTQSFGVKFNSERTVDVNSQEGQGLVSQYKITKVPTILMSPDVGQYAVIKQVWAQVGTIETDGWYIFREMALLGNITYKDLTNNQIINPAQPSLSPSPTGTKQ